MVDCRLLFSAKMELVLCEDESKVKKLLGDSSQLPGIKTLVHLHPVSEEITKAVEAVGWQIVSFAEMEASTKLFVDSIFYSFS